MDKRFDHGKEFELYAMWEREGYFSPEGCVKRGVAQADAPVFSMVLPPPNVTGELHMGHAAMLALEDTIVRYHRMRGERVLWVPSTDHAAIATQSRVEKDLYKETGETRRDIGRDEFLKRVEAFAAASHDTIVRQIRAMGASLDWGREAFTLDDKRSAAVRTAFKRMYDDGLVYRGHRVVNWDVKGQTTISDDEVVYEARKAKLYTFRYDAQLPISISTTRPETKFGDVAVAVHPSDPRYQQFVGKKFDVDFCGTPLSITVITDTSVDREFGTGALGVTPAHSMIDWEIAERHKLPFKQVIDERGSMLVENPLVHGKSVAEARDVTAEELRRRGLMEREEDVTQNVATAERTGAVIEPLPKLQWFVDVNKSVNGKSLKARMREAVASGAVAIVPERFTNVYFQWIDNLRDWCISRQIWYGHRIPVWYKDNETYVGIDAPQGDGWTQDPDTLDTWFSSGLWTFSTLGWPETTSDLKTYHPTSLLETGYDILFFWVARMILMSTYLLRDVPFRTVYLHGMVRDAKGRKMSKSLGNGINPLDMTAKYGADATRLAFIVGVGPGSDMNMSEDKIRASRNFGTKIWNVGRFLEMRRPEGWKDDGAVVTLPVKAEVTKHLDNYELHLAAERAYDDFWNEFANKTLEESKPLLETNPHETYARLLAAFRAYLKLLHPFMPFVTEAVWQELRLGRGMLIGERW